MNEKCLRELILYDSDCEETDCPHPLTVKIHCGRPKDHPGDCSLTSETESGTGFTVTWHVL